MPDLVLNVEEVFVTEGVPAFTFVKPPNFAEILVDIRRPGKPVIIEGQSGTGKTTCVKNVLTELRDEVPTSYLSARKAEDVSKIVELSRNPKGGRFIIDDFHRLGQDVQTRLADIAKIAAEEGAETALPKLIIIGINKTGSDLIQLVPDIAKRTGIHRILPGREEEIGQLIQTGCEKLNIIIDNSNKIFGESRGDYWLTQQLCQSLCVLGGVSETCKQKTNVSVNLDAVRESVVRKLDGSYRPAVKEFCRGRRFRPSNDPYFKLLRLVGKQDSSIVDLNDLANSNPEFRGSINNIKDGRLNTLLDSKPNASSQFYYNSDTKSFAIEDPALFYYLKYLDWEEIRKECGFRNDEVDYAYDVAISFAGENRELAELIAGSLAELDVPVFYDRNFESNFLGQAWTAQFKSIFGKESRIVLCLLDKHHAEKMWPTFEREYFMPRVKDGSVIPVFMDDTSFVGIPKDVIGISFKFDPKEEGWEGRAIDQIVMKLIDKLSE